MRETWWLAPGARTPLEARAPLDVAAWMQPAEDRMRLSSDRQSAAVRWGTVAPLLVKWRAPLAVRRWRSVLRRSRERAEASAAARAAARGIATPQALAVGERRQGGVLRGAVLVRTFDPQATSAAEAARAQPSVVLAVARALRSWHDAGLRHGDCYPKNVLVGGTSATPRPIGFPKAIFVRQGMDLDRARLRDLGQFTAGCAALEPWGDPFSFLTAYLESPGLPAFDALRASVMPFYERVMARKAERVRTRPQREPAGPPPPQPLALGTKPRVRIRNLR